MPEVKVVIPPDMEYIDGMYTLIDSVMTKMNAEKKDVFDVKLAVSEGVTNAIRHAKSHVRIVIAYNVGKGRLDFDIFNDGEPFTPSNDEFVMPDMFEEHKRGIYLMNAYMDEIGYENTDNGTLLHLTKLIRR